MEAYLERYRDIVDDWPAFAEAAARPLPMGVWAHPGRIGRDELIRHLEALGMPGRPTPWNPHGFTLNADARPGMSWPYLAGLCHVQEEVATAAVRLLDPRPGERVLDLCAAPGNKTAQIATALGGRGTVVAREVEIGRMPALRNAVERLGLFNVATSPGDATDAGFVESCTGEFDAVLADVPCTSDGTSRRSPRVLRRCSPALSRGMQGRQIRLLRAAIAMCRPGGRVVYATCTYAPEENEAVVDAVVEESRGTVRVRPAALPGLRAAPGLVEWEGRRFDPSLAGSLRIWPHLNDTGGFFIAVLDVTGRAPWVNGGGEGARASEAEGSTADLGVPADDDASIASIVEHFGLPSAALAGIRFVRRNRQGLHAVAADHAPPRASEPDSVGFLFVRDDGRVPKLTTAGALAIGRAATRNVVELDRAATGAFLAREHVVLGGGVSGGGVMGEGVLGDGMMGDGGIGSGASGDGETRGQVIARGYLIARCGGYPLGVGWMGGAEQEPRTLQSMYPKGWGAGGGGEGA